MANLINPEDVRAWCESRARGLPPMLSAWVTGNVRNHLVRDPDVHRLAEGGDELDLLLSARRGRPSWVAAILAADPSAAFHVFDSSAPAVVAFGEDLAYCLDWLSALPDDDRHLRGLTRMSVPAVLTESVKWHGRLARRAMVTPPPDDPDGVSLWRDAGDGLSWVALSSRAAMTRESDLMGHCVGRSSTYLRRVQVGDGLILSLRDATNLPHVTLEVDFTTKTGASLVQVKGKSDRVPVPKYHATVRALVVAEGWRAESADCSAVGMAFFGGRQYLFPDEVATDAAALLAQECGAAGYLSANAASLGEDARGMAADALVNRAITMASGGARPMVARVALIGLIPFLPCLPVGRRDELLATVCAAPALLEVSHSFGRQGQFWRFFSAAVLAASEQGREAAFVAAAGLLGGEASRNVWEFLRDHASSLTAMARRSVVDVMARMSTLRIEALPSPLSGGAVEVRERVVVVACPALTALRDGVGGDEAAVECARMGRLLLDELGRGGGALTSIRIDGLLGREDTASFLLASGAAAGFSVISSKARAARTATLSEAASRLAHAARTAPEGSAVRAACLNAARVSLPRLRQRLAADALLL